jgi:hypothetical protein
VLLGAGEQRGAHPKRDNQSETAQRTPPGDQWCLYQPTPRISFHEVVWWQRKH